MKCILAEQICKGQVVRKLGKRKWLPVVDRFTDALSVIIYVKVSPSTFKSMTLSRTEKMEVLT